MNKDARLRHGNNKSGYTTRLFRFRSNQPTTGMRRRNRSKQNPQFRYFVLTKITCLWHPYIDILVNRTCCLRKLRYGAYSTLEKPAPGSILIRSVVKETLAPFVSGPLLATTNLPASKQDK